MSAGRDTAAASAPTCPGPDPRPRPPRLMVPPASCDCHAHVFGPAARYPYAGNRSYTPPDAPLEAYLRLLGVLGLERAVIVQASVQGIDNRCILDALARADGRFRGIAVVAADVDEATLRRLHDGGVRGVRMTTFVKGGTGAEHVTALARRIRPLGWIVQLHLGNVEELPALAPRLVALPVPYLIDHFGRARGDQGVDNTGFRALLRLLREDDKCWVKLCSPYRLSRSGPPRYADMTPLAHALIEACPDRVVWGSNWPHPNFHGPMPNDGDVLDLLLDWAPDAAVRRRILADNPARLFGFPGP